MLIEKDQLLPFEEVKLYGHNAIHALMAYLGASKGYSMMSQLRDDLEIMQIARDAFIKESGAALIKKYSYLDDELFTETGFKNYAEDLLARMTNPFLEDTIARAGRDPIRKLGLHDRLFGAMTLSLEQGIEPENIALGAAAGIVFLQRCHKDMFEDFKIDAKQSLPPSDFEKILIELWEGNKTVHMKQIVLYLRRAYLKLIIMSQRF